MKNNSLRIFLAMCFLALGTHQVRAQYMPVVYDNTYGKESQFNQGVALLSGDVIMIGSNGDHPMVTWLDRFGKVRLSKTFAGEFVQIRKVIPVDDGKVLLVGNSNAASNSKRADQEATGRAMLLSVDGRIERDVRIGKPGAYISDGELLSSGVLVLAGSEPAAAGVGRVGFISKLDRRDRVVYHYTQTVGTDCLSFDVMGANGTEWVNVAFTGGKEGSSVVRLDDQGKPFYITRMLNDASFNLEKMISFTDGYIVVTGSSALSGGVVLKLRPEGDVVYQKQIVPAIAGATMPYLMVGSGGEVLVGGSGGGQGFYSLLRSDGTELSSNVTGADVTGLCLNQHSGESIISFFNPEKNAGSVIKISNIGRKLYERSVVTKYNNIKVDDQGFVLLGSSDAGRLTMFSSFGEVLFDRYAQENNPMKFNDVYFSDNGDVIFSGQTNRVVKLAHGLLVSDVTISKPINGFATATFTVTLTGYSTNLLGAPIPVTVNFGTTGKTAGADNFVPRKGTLSFIPTSDGGERFLTKQVIEIPIKANDYLEGRREFEVALADVQNSYLIKPIAIGTIEDQPAMVRLISSTNGLEGSVDVVYKLGIFKTNGVELTNRTGADVVVDGVYGSGTADALDYDMGRTPRVKIVNGAKDGTFNVVTSSNTRYELPRKVVIDFNKIYALSDATVLFPSSVLSCEGRIIDQPAQVLISSLGDHGQLNNSVSGFFKISLVRASDGALLTNNSGGDIVIAASLDGNTTAKEGVDFVLTNLHDLRIWGDSRQSAVNLSGVVLFNNDTTPKTVGVKLNGIKVPEGANPISIVADKQAASFTIKQQ